MRKTSHFPIFDVVYWKKCATFSRLDAYFPLVAFKIHGTCKGKGGGESHMLRSFQGSKVTWRGVWGIQNLREISFVLKKYTRIMFKHWLLKRSSSCMKITIRKHYRRNLLLLRHFPTIVVKSVKGNKKTIVTTHISKRVSICK